MIHIEPPASFTKRTYVMVDDKSKLFRHSIARMKELGYKVETVPIEKDYQQSQFLGSQTKML